MRLARKIFFVFAAFAFGAQATVAQPATRGVRKLTLNEAIITALENNRDLQIERINPEIARATLSALYGIYDPVFLGDVRRENDKDTGGFDPANFSADAVYEAESTIASAGIYGALPSGMTYSLSGNYAHSEGTRNSLDFESYKVFTGITGRQPLLRNFWIDAGRHAIRISKQNVKLSDLAVRFVAMDVINRVEQAYFELAYAHEARRVQEQLVASRRKMLSGTRRKIESGLATAPDEQLAQAQLSTAEAGLSAAFTGVALAENMLRTALGDSFTNQVNTSWVPADYLLLIPAGIDLRESWSKGVELRPDLEHARIEVEKAKLDVHYRVNQLFPTLDIVGSYGRRGASTDQDVSPFTASASLSDTLGQISSGDAPRDMFGIVFSMPLSRRAERNNLKAAKHTRAQTELMLKQKIELVLREISDAFHTARTSYERAKAAHAAADASRNALVAEEKRLAGGTSSIFFVLQLQDDLVKAQLVEVRARADYNKAMAQLRFAEGSSLDESRIGFTAP
jgi:outer membrane protein TolC